jgi:hypothetical protein
VQVSDVAELMDETVHVPVDAEVRTSPTWSWLAKLVLVPVTTAADDAAVPGPVNASERSATQVLLAIFAVSRATNAVAGAVTQVNTVLLVIVETVQDFAGVAVL